MVEAQPAAKRHCNTHDPGLPTPPSRAPDEVSAHDRQDSTAEANVTLEVGHPSCHVNAAQSGAQQTVDAVSQGQALARRARSLRQFKLPGREVRWKLESDVGFR